MKFITKAQFCRCFLIATAVVFVIPYLGALFLAYSRPGPGDQAWLDKVTARVEQLCENCDDPELRAVLAYTAWKYRRIGPFEVSVRDCGDNTLGLNTPHCPGVTIDPRVVDSRPIDIGVIILVHEAYHDYFPFLGHSQYRGIIPSVAGTDLTKLEKLMRAT